MVIAIIHSCIILVDTYCTGRIHSSECKALAWCLPVCLSVPREQHTYSSWPTSYDLVALNKVFISPESTR